MKKTSSIRTGRLLKLLQNNFEKVGLTSISKYKHFIKIESYHLRNFKKGDLVLIKSYNLPPSRWPLGRILNTYSGKDNIVRATDVKTPTDVLVKTIL